MAASASMVMFQKTLQDLVKGIRSHKRDESPYISQAIVEIKAELKSTDPFTKAEAVKRCYLFWSFISTMCISMSYHMEQVRKLTYLQMLGYNFGWASFGIVEVMSSPRFAHKRIGYLAANQVRRC
jgi:AP-3 complex subunit delta-1